MVACKTVGEYKRNQEKVRKFCLEEARNNASSKQLKNQGQPTESNWTNEKVKKLAQAYQQQQQRTAKRKVPAKPTSPRTPKTNKRKLSASKPPAQVSFNMRAQQAALNYASESSKTKRPSINKVEQFTDDTNDNPDTVIYNIQQDSDAYPPIQIVASSDPRIFSDPTFTNSQDRQPISSDTDLQEECPISIIPAPTKSSTKTTEQVQMDTTEYTTTEKETIQMDQDIGDSLIVKDQLRPPSVFSSTLLMEIQKDQATTPARYLTRQSKSKTRKNKQIHQRPKVSLAKPQQLQQLDMQQRATLQAERQVYMLLPPCHPTRERTQIVVPPIYTHKLKKELLEIAFRLPQRGVCDTPCGDITKHFKYYV